MTEQNSPPAAASSNPDTPKGARAVCSIAVDAITVPSERLRKLRPEVVDWLVESITARSLLEPIIVRRRGAGYELIAGHHRFEAARNCSHQTIRAEVYDSLSDDEAELIQIDENLIRANLSDAERILHVARRKQLYEKLHPETKHGGDRRSAGARSSSQNENLKAFVADIAVKTGKGRSTVARDVTRAKKVAVLDDIAGTCLDKGDEIDALGKLPEGEQRKLATAARAGEKVSAKALRISLHRLSSPLRTRVCSKNYANFRMCALALFVEGQFPQCSANVSCSVFFTAFFKTKFRSKQIVPVIVICEFHNQLPPFVRDFRQLCFHQKSDNNIFGGSFNSNANPNTQYSVNRQQN